MGVRALIRNLPACKVEKEGKSKRRGQKSPDLCFDVKIEVKVGRSVRLMELNKPSARGIVLCFEWSQFLR